MTASNRKQSFEAARHDWRVKSKACKTSVENVWSSRWQAKQPTGHLNAKVLSHHGLCIMWLVQTHNHYTHVYYQKVVLYICANCCSKVVFNTTMSTIFKLYINIDLLYIYYMNIPMFVYFPHAHVHGMYFYLFRPIPKSFSHSIFK